jgi:hypothetical protein
VIIIVDLTLFLEIIKLGKVDFKVALDSLSLG